DVRIEYHPSSGKPPVITPLSDLRREGDAPSAFNCEAPRNREPWVGFRTRLDYEICEFIIHTRLNTEETKRLLKLIHCAQDTREFTVKSIEDLNERWRLAAQATLYKTTTFTAEGEGYKESYEMHHTSMLDWARSLVTDPELKDHLVYDAQRMFIHNGQKFERWVDEPYTANRLWNIQV
ncbi:hypothetical protein HDZ31DRAFT_16776, partial [Schizophyllum fasciatum]